MNHRLLAYAGLILTTALMVVVVGAWKALVWYRIQDGRSFEEDTTFRHELSGHRCARSIYEACFHHLPGEPRDYDNECAQPVTSRCRCDHLTEAFCYTAFPLDCASWRDGGEVQHGTCGKVFPHGWEHVKGLATP